MTKDSANNVIALNPRDSSVSAWPRQNTLDSSGFLRIERVRYFANCYALHPKGDWEQACRVISVHPQATLKSYAFALLGALDAHALRPILFYQNGSKSLSDGEVWIGRLFNAISQSDHANVQALLSFRLSPIAHRRVAFLGTGLLAALTFEQLTPDQ